MRVSLLMSVPLVLATVSAPLNAQVTHSWEVKWVRDSEEYATLTRQIYRVAQRQVAASREALPRGRAWAVVLDVDQTALDNSVYELERRAYAQPHDTVLYSAWAARREAVPVPGVSEFLAAVRRLGGRVAWITNRNESDRENTRANLAAVGLWNDADRLCLLVPSEPAYTKAARRAEVLSGGGRCGFGEPVTVLAYFGDQLGDLPAAGEGDPDAGNDVAFGARYFLLPNPMYGAWTNRVTRRR
jgi:5'-nucleotidase (lipoprotein e(P4) family)